MSSGFAVLSSVPLEDSKNSEVSEVSDACVVCVVSRKEVLSEDVLLWDVL